MRQRLFFLPLLLLLLSNCGDADQPPKIVGFNDQTSIWYSGEGFAEDTLTVISGRETLLRVHVAWNLDEENVPHWKAVDNFTFKVRSRGSALAVTGSGDLALFSGSASIRDPREPETLVFPVVNGIAQADSGFLVRVIADVAGTWHVRTENGDTHWMLDLFQNGRSITAFAPDLGLMVSCELTANEIRPVWSITPDFRIWLQERDSGKLQLYFDAEPLDLVITRERE